VVEIRRSFFGYGREIVIDHGFGYKTRYAHLQDMNVKMGDEVVRGQQIATMGNTGKSKGVHLHYEVIYRNSRVNPLNYYNQEIRGEEYMAMVNPHEVQVQ
jgi:murein DD-endopeptidase MepM/ murein hydrolase activator NlpD